MEASTTKKRSVELTLREAILPAKVSEWRAKLSAKAKQEKRYRFYSLYGLISHAETLKAAWHQVRANGGAAGVDVTPTKRWKRSGKISEQGSARFTTRISKGTSTPFRTTS